MLPRPAALLSRNSANCSLSTTLALARAFQNSLRSTSSLSKSSLRALNKDEPSLVVVVDIINREVLQDPKGLHNLRAHSI